MVILYDDQKIMRRNQQKVRTILLFSDVLLVTKYKASQNKYHLKFVVYLNRWMHLEHNPRVPAGISADMRDNVFKLRSERTSHSLILMAKTLEQKMSWIIALERVLINTKP